MTQRQEPCIFSSTACGQALNPALDSALDSAPNSSAPTNVPRSGAHLQIPSTPVQNRVMSRRNLKGRKRGEGFCASRSFSRTASHRIGGFHSLSVYALGSRLPTATLDATLDSSTAPGRVPPLTKDRNTKPEITQDRRECDGALGPLPKLRPISTRPGAIDLVLQLVYSPLSGDATSFLHPRLRGPPTGFSVSCVVHMPGTGLDGVLRRV